MHTSEFLNGIYIEKNVSAKTKTKDAMLFLHGYPANIGFKNRDLADFINNELKIDTYLIHYRGLGNSPGKFRFSDSLEDVFSAIKYMKSLGYEKIHFVGHSWGGFLTLKANEYWSSDSKIILISPFINFPHGDELKLLVKHIYGETNQFLNHLSEDEIYNDLNSIRESKENLSEIVKSKPNKISLIQSIHDDETPREYAEIFARNIINQINYYEIESDHSFSINRALLKKILIKEIYEYNK